MGNSIYHTAQLYDDIHWWKTNDMEFWVNIFNEIEGEKVLELACGTGRLAPCLLREGASYTGLEIVPDFVRAAKKKLVNYSNMVSIIPGDMCSFNLNKKFDLIFIGFNSFLHLLTNADALKFFSCVKAHMHNNTRFIIDIYIPSPLFLYRPEEVRFPVLEYIDSQTKEQVFVEERNSYSSETEINELEWFFSTKDKKDFDRCKFSMRMYFPSQMNTMLIDAGFKIIHQWGDYFRTQINDGSNLQIYDVKLNQEKFDV